MQTQMKPADFIELSHILGNVIERSKPVFEQYLVRSREELCRQNFDPLNVNPLYTEFIERLSAHPDKILSLQNDLWLQYLKLWKHTTLKALGEETNDIVKPDKSDRRFSSEDWQINPLFDFLKQSYLLTCQAVQNAVHDVDGLDEYEKEKIAFHSQLFMNALSPSNYLMSNPDVIRETLSTGGANLVKGLENLLKDLERGNGSLKISTTDFEAFELGKNLATTKGEVVYQNELMQLIQYYPTTKTCFKRPLLIVPPWINKYYILDLQPENSFIKWLVDHGHNVFTISWVNPGAKLAGKKFEDYMASGVIEAMEEIKHITGEPDVNAIGYCLGGTLLATTLAYLAAKGQADQIASATFFATLIDFEHCGEMKMFLDDEQLAIMDRMMNEKGLFEARQLQQTFSLLRSNDLIWNFVVNNYLMGKEPFPFDLLYWNDDSTNMPARMHSYYLRHMYRDNLLKEPGGIVMKDTAIDLRKVKTPAYFLSTRDDHIAPWRATYEGTQLFSGKKTFTLSASGHVAGVINHPQKKKYCYWTDDQTPKDAEAWLEGSSKHQGSWWPHWLAWSKKYADKRIPARVPEQGIEPAPGSYVRVRA